MKKEFLPNSDRRAQAQDTNQTSLGKPLAKTTATTDPKKKQDAVARKRFVQYEFDAADLETGAGAVVTDSASNLNNLPYAITGATDKIKIVFPKANPKVKTSFATLTKGKTKGNFITFTAEIPEDIEEVVIYLGNDAYAKRRLHPLFKVKPSEQGITVVKIYETHKKALDKKRTKSPTDYPEAAQSQTVSKTGNLFVGYLTGDVWKQFSYEFNEADVTRLCKQSTLKRKFAADRGRKEITSASPAATPLDFISFRPPPMAIDNTRVVINRRIDDNFALQSQSQNVETANAAVKPLKDGEEEMLEITDWSLVLAPIYSGLIQGLSGDKPSSFTCHVDLPIVNVRLLYQSGSFNNALGAGENVTIADVLKRTHPLAYKGVVEAAWKAGVEIVTLSSTWRPMLGSILHRMGVSIDVVFIDDLDDRDGKKNQIKEFKVHLNSGKSPSTLYSAFQTHIFEDKDDLGGFKADPWKRKPIDNLHKNHLHISATDADAV